MRSTQPHRRHIAAGFARLITLVALVAGWLLPPTRAIGADRALSIDQNCYMQPVECTVINDHFKANGDARMAGSNFLTSAQAGQRGSIFWKRPIALNDSRDFSASFAFQMTAAYSRTGGLVFTVQSSANDFLSPAGSLGYEGLSPSIAIEFDSEKNTEHNDPNDKHVGIDIGGNTTSEVTANLPGDYNYHYTTCYVWVDYAGSAQRLEVRLSLNDPQRPADALLTYTVNLSSFLGADVYPGFTAAAGDGGMGVTVYNFFFMNEYLSEGIQPWEYTYTQAPVEVNLSLADPLLKLQGTNATEAVATVLDVDGQPIVGQSVAFSIGGTGVAELSSSATAVTDVDGKARAELQGISAGTATVRAQTYGGALGTAEVEVQDLRPIVNGPDPRALSLDEDSGATTFQVSATDPEGLGADGWVIARMPTAGAASIVAQTFGATGTVTATVAYTPTATPDWYGGDSFDLEIRKTHNASILSRTLAVSVTVAPLNDPPTLTAPTSQLILAQNDRQVFSAAAGTAITITDDSEGNPVQLTVEASNGTAHLASTAGLSVVGGANGTGLVTVQGALADLRAALGGLEFRPTADYLGPASLRLTLDDLGQVGGGALTVGATVPLLVLLPNKVPTVTVPFYSTNSFSNTTAISLPLNAGASLYPSEIGVGGLEGTVSRVSVTLHAVAHSFPADLDVLLVAPDGKAVTLLSDAGGSADLAGADLTFAGGAPAAPALTQIASGTYAPSDYDTGGDDQFAAPAPVTRSTDLSSLAGSDPNGAWHLFVRDDYRERDSGAIAGGWSMDLTTVGYPAIDEDTSLTVGNGVGAPLTVADPDAADAPTIQGRDLKVTLSAAHGTLDLGTWDPVTFVDGQPQSARFTIKGSQVALNQALDGLVFRPTADFSGAAPITVTVDDMGAYGAGPAGKTTVVFTVTVRPVLDGVPSVTPATTAEDTQSTAGLVVRADPRDQLEVSHFRITGVASGTLYLSDGTTEVRDGDFITAAQGTAGLRFTPAPDWHGTTTIQAQGASAAGPGFLLATPVTGTITVTPVNDRPTLDPIADVVSPAGAGEETVSLAGISSGAADEDEGFTVTATSSDEELVVPSVEYTSPAGGGTLRFTPRAGVEGAATITVRVTDSGIPPAWVERQFKVAVGVQNQAPTLDALDPLSVDEDAAEQVVALKGIGVGDPSEAPTQTVALEAISSAPAIIPDPTLSYVAGQATGSMRLTPLPDAYGTVTITVRVTDTGRPPLTSQRQLVVEVRPVNDSPSFVKGINEAVEDTAGPQRVALWAVRVTAGRNEGHQGLRFEVGADNRAIFAAQPAVSADGTLTYAPQVGAEGTATVSVTLVDDGGGADRSATERFKITVYAGNTAPAFTLSRATLQLREDFVGAEAVMARPGPVPPADAGQTVRYRLDPPTVPFATLGFNPASGRLEVAALADAFGTAVLRIIADDGQARNYRYEQSLTLEVAAVNDAPTLEPLPAITMVEDADTRTVALSGIGNGAANEMQPITVEAFSSNPAVTGLVTTEYDYPDGVGTIQFTLRANRSGSAIMTVRVTESDPQAVTERTFAVEVTALNDPPTLEAPDKLFASPNAPTPFGAIEAADGDSADAPVRLTLRVDHGELALLTTVSGGVTAAQVSGNKTGTVTVGAALAAVRATLAAEGGLLYRQSPAYIGPDLLQITLDDQGGSGEGGPQTAAVAVPITVSPVADMELSVKLQDLAAAALSPACTLAGGGARRLYITVVENAGPDTGTGVTVIAGLPDGATLERIVPSQGTCQVGEQITCELGSVAMGRQAVIEFTVAGAPEVGSPADLRLRLLADQVDPSPPMEAKVFTGTIRYPTFLPLLGR